jgi:hypothetical protein
MSVKTIESYARIVKKPINSIDGINVLRDFLRDYLEDPYILAGGKERTSWIFTDNPFSNATYPRVKLSLHNHSATPIDIGPNYMDWERVFVKIDFFTKQDFKVEIDGVVYKNEQLVHKYQNTIHDTLKEKFNELYSNGVKGYKLEGMSQSGFDPEYVCHKGYIIIRFWLFRR